MQRFYPFPQIQTKKPSHHGEKASLFTGKFERAIDLSCMAGNDKSIYGGKEGCRSIWMP